MTDYKRILLAQFGVTSPLVSFTPYRGLVWWYKVSITQDEVDNSFWTVNFNAHYDDPPIDETIIINTVSWNGRQLNEIDNLDDLFLETVINSFFMDTDNQILYIKNFDYLPVWQTPNLVSGEVTGVTSQADVDENGRPFNLAFGGLEYEVRLIEDSISDSFKLDNWANNLMQFDSFSFQLINSDGRYDHIRDDVMNQTARLLVAEVPASKAVDINDFRAIATGNINDVSFPDSNTAQLSVSDIRDEWQDIFPKEVYGTTFQGVTVRDELLGQSFPVVFGACRFVPAYKVSETDDLYHLSWASPEYPITSVGDLVYFDGETWVTVPKVGDPDLETGTVTLDNGSQFDGEVLYARTMVGHVAPSISLTDPTGGTALDTAIYLTQIWANKPFISSYYELGHIREVRDRRPYQIGVAFPTGGGAISQAIEACTFSINTVFYTNGEALDIAEMTVETTPFKTVYVDDLINVPPIVWDKGDYMTRIKVNYYKNYESDNFLTVNDAQYEASALSRYIFPLQYEFDTALVTAADAGTLGLERYQWGVLIRPKITLQFGAPMELNFLDVVSFDYNQHGRQRLEPALYRVTGISRTRNEAELTFIESVAFNVRGRA